MLVLIPARYQSSRFPGKPLADICGKSMIQRVYTNSTSATASNETPSLKFDVYVVTDDKRIQDHVEAFGGKVLRVDEPVTTGTERIFLAWQNHLKDVDYSLIINVQGDEPLLKGEEISKLSSFHLGSEFSIGTIVRARQDWEDFENPNNVKAIFSRVKNQCLYFSRAPIPFDRDNEKKEWFHHIGVYSYTPEALKTFCKTEKTYYEELEKLEQLRALEAGLTIGAVVTNAELMGVDTPEDIKAIEGVLSEPTK